MKSNASAAIFLILFFTLSSITPISSYAHSELEVGIASTNLDMEIGIPLAGYGSKSRKLEFPDFLGKIKHCTFLKPSTGKLDELRSKVMVLKKGSKYLFFISVDTIGISKKIFKDVYKYLKPLGIGKEDIFLTATHTHSGPGTLSKNIALNIIAADLFIEKNYQHFLRKIKRSISEALANLQPAELYKTKFQTSGLQRNKWRKKGQGHFETEAKILLAKSQNGNWLGGIINYSLHGNGYGSKNLQFSADVQGHVERNMQKHFENLNPNGSDKVTFLWASHAQGDVKVIQGGTASLAHVGQEFVKQGIQAFKNPVKIDSNFSSRRKWIFLGVPTVNAGDCAGKSAKKSIRVSIFPFFQASTWLTAAKIGDITIMSWPGEPSTSLGWELMDAAKSIGHEDPWVFALTNDYMAYFTNKEESKEAVYDTCSSLFRWRGGDRIIKKHMKLLDELI